MKNQSKTTLKKKTISNSTACSEIRSFNISERGRNMPFSLDINALRLSKRTTQPNLQAVEVFWFNLVIKSIKAVD